MEEKEEVLKENAFTEVRIDEEERTGIKLCIEPR